MKIAIIGGGGVRTPLLVNGLAQSDLPISEIALFDIDGARLAAMCAIERNTFAIGVPSGALMCSPPFS